ncbi:MAG TPA: hypothetical protein VGI45_18010 [Terracidiphilus sp.]|jgi:hypothetical protein
MAKPDPNLEIVTVFESDDLVAFELAKAVLDEAGVDYLAREDPPAGYGFSPILHPVRRILMPAYRKDEALELIAGVQQEAESSEHENGEPPQ